MAIPSELNDREHRKFKDVGSKPVVQVAVVDGSGDQVTSFGGSGASNTISTNNSTTSTLAGDAVYTGTGDDVANYSTITVQLDASHDSATDGMSFQFSIDNSNWDDTYTFTYTAADGARRFQFPVTARYFRIVYTNGSTLQTHFRVQTILHTTSTLTTIHRLVDDTKPDRSAELVKSAIIAQVNGTGDFTPIQANAGGILKVGGSVDVDSSALPTGAATAANQLPDGHNVTIDNASGASAVNIQDGGNTITVDGTVTANLSATDNAVLDTIDADTSILSAGVLGSKYQSNISQLGGTGIPFWGDSSGGEGADTGVAMYGVRRDAPSSSLTSTDEDYTPFTANKLGSIRTAYPEDDLATAATNHVKKYYTSTGAATDGIVWSPAAGKRWYITDLIINVSAAATVTLEDDLTAGDSAVFKAELAANSGISHSFNTPLYSGEDAADLLITTSAGNVYVTVTGYEI